MTATSGASRSHGAQLAAILAEVMSLGKQIPAISQDAREGRDGMLALKASLDAQKLGDRMASLERRLANYPETVRGIVKAELLEAQDNTNERFLRVEADVARHGGQIKTLEDVHSQRRGVEGLVGAVLRHIPTIFSSIVAAVAAVIAWFSWRHPHH